MKEIELGDDYRIEETQNGEFQVTHKPSGNTWLFDPTDEEWDLGALLAADATHQDSYTDPGGTTHTGTLADAGDVRTDEEIEDVVDALVSAGDKLSWTYDDQNDQLTIDTTALDEEEVEDAVAQLLTGGSNISVSYDDPNDTLTVSLDAHASTHEKGGGDELTTFGDTTHDSVSADKLNNTTHYIATSDDPQTVADDAGANSHLVFLSGTHDVDVGDLETWLQITNDNVTVEIGAGAELRIPDNQHDGSESGMEIIQLGEPGGSGVNNCTVKGDGEINGNKGNNSDPGTGDLRTVHIEEGCQNIDVRDITVYDMYGQVVRPQGVSTNVLKDIEISGLTLRNVNEGILFTHCEETTVSDCTIRNTIGQDAIEPANGAVGWTVEANVIVDNTGSAIDVYSGAENGTVVGNTSINSNGSAIEVGAGSTATKQITVADNVIQGANDNGIEVFSGGGNTRRVTVRGNTVANPSARGIDVEGNADGTTVEGNVVFLASDGIRARSGLNDFAINDNRVVSCSSRGIYVPGGSDGTINDNRVESASEIGIFIAATDTSVCGNTVRNCDNDGINAGGDKCNIEDNKVKNNGQSGSTYAGIVSSGTDRLLIADNQVYDDQGTTTQEEGIALENTMSNSFVQGNAVWGHNTNIADSSAASTDVQNNKTG